MGSAADPWRVAQARHRNRADECGQVYGQAVRPAVPRLEDFPSQSCRWHRRYGSVRRADNLVSSALWTADRGARPTTDRMARRHSASDRRMDCKSDYGSFRLGTGSHYPIRDCDRAYGNVFIRRLRSIGIRDRPTSPRSPWQNGCAERLIGSIRRECLYHVVVLGERHLRHVLLSYLKYYRGTHASSVGEGCAGLARYRTGRTHSLSPSSRRATPPICSDLICDRDTYLRRHGKPVAFHSDKHSIFRVSNENAVSGNGMTQFGRALSELNIEILCANTSQAKGRVERAHHTLQD